MAAQIRLTRVFSTNWFESLDKTPILLRTSSEPINMLSLSSLILGNIYPRVNFSFPSYRLFVAIRLEALFILLDHHPVRIPLQWANRLELLALTLSVSPRFVSRRMCIPINRLCLKMLQKLTQVHRSKSTIMRQVLIESNSNLFWTKIDWFFFLAGVKKSHIYPWTWALIIGPSVDAPAQHVSKYMSNYAALYPYALQVLAISKQSIYWTRRAKKVNFSRVVLRSFELTKLGLYTYSLRLSDLSSTC